MKKILAILALISQPLLADPVDFQLPDLQGNPLQLSDYRGRWVVVNFWASWCSPCVQELPELAAYQREHAGQVQVIGINFEEISAEDAQAFLDGLPPTGFPHLKYDGSGDGIPLAFFTAADGRQLSLQGLPSTFFVDPQGEMRDMHLGPLTAESLAAKLQQLGESD